MYISKSNFLVIGLATSGLAATKAIISRGGKCMIYDESSASHILKNKESLLLIGAVDASNDIVSAINWCDVVVLSPGIPIDHKISIMAKKQGKRVVGELELGSTLIKSPMVAITGTNGKTTTCSLVNSIINKAQINCELVGNIGTPMCDKISELNENSLAVVEVSSFQLETIHSFCPHIAAILNITPDHLSRHYNVENYVYLKNRILMNMRESEFAVLNYDDEKVKNFSRNAKCKIVYFSRHGEVDGAYLKDDNIYFKGEYIMNKNSIKLEGQHNEENVLAAIACCKILKIDNSYIESAISEFSGVKHRIELVGEIDEVKFYNDSKATNVEATIKAIESMTNPTVLILGGKDKGLNYSSLCDKIKNSYVCHVVLVGECRYKMLEQFRQSGFEKISLTNDFESAIKIAEMECPSGGAVLLSPATSSFDMFSCFEERGNEFIRIVNELRE